MKQTSNITNAAITNISTLYTYFNCYRRILFLIFVYHFYFYEVVEIKGVFVSTHYYHHLIIKS